MDWNAPLTAKRFLLIFWVPVLLLGAAYRLYRANVPAEEPTAPTAMEHHQATNVPRVTQEQLAREAEERRLNLEASKQSFNHSH